MRVLHIAGLAIIFAVVRSTTSTASGQRWANKPYETPGGYTRPPTMRPNVHAPHVYKREAPISTMSGQHSLPDSTKTMTVDYPKHHHRSRPVIHPGVLGVNTGPFPSKADSEEHTMPVVMTEDNEMMLSEEFTNAPESNEAMNEEISEHNDFITIHEFKEALHELVHNAVEKSVDDIIVKFKIGHLGKASGRDPQAGCGVPGINIGVL